MQDRLVCLNAFREAVSLTKSDCRLAQVGSRVAAGTPYGKLPEGPEPSGEFRWQEFSTRLATPLRETVEFVESDSTVSTILPGGHCGGYRYPAGRRRKGGQTEAQKSNR